MLPRLHFISLVLFTVYLLPSIQRTSCLNKTYINIGALLYKIGPDRFGYNRSIHLANLLIENSTHFKHLTERYELRLKITDTYGIPYITIKHACELSDLEPSPLAVIGPASSVVLDYAVETLKRIGSLLVPYSTNIRDDPKKFRFVMSSSSGIKQEIAARMSFMKEFNWKRAAVIYDKRDQFLVTFADKMFDSLKLNNITLTGAAAIEPRSLYKYVDNPRALIQTKLKELKNEDTKIFFSETDPYSTLVLFCEVYHLKMYGPDIVWLVNSYARDVSRWLYYNSSTRGQPVSCSKEQIREAAKGVFSFERQMIREDSNRTASGLTADEYINELIDLSAPKDNNNTEALKSSSLAFDAFWAVAIALNNSIDPLEKMNKTLNDSSFAKEEVLKRMKEVDFEGIAGPYSYSKDSSTRDGTILISQFKDGLKKVKIGKHVTKKDKLSFVNDTKNLWENGKVPKDRSTLKTLVLTVESRLYIAVSTAAAIGILLGILFLTFNLVYRKYKFIKLSAPLFNNIIASGCILCLISVFLFGVHDIENPETSFALVCKARAWTLTIGFSCAFGAMFVKTWRIYKICTNKKLRVKLGPLSDWYLLSLVGMIIVIDLIILITWELSDPIKHRSFQINKEPRKEDAYPFTFFNDIVNTCYSNNMIVWLTVIYVYKGILILYGLFLAYETRNVIYAHLNDSRVIGICVYNVVVLSVVGAFLSLLLGYKNYQEMYIVLSVCIIFPAVVTICLMMFPKVAYRCKTNNLDDTETIGNGMTTVRGSFDVASTCRQVPVPTQHVPNDNTLHATSTKNVQFSYQNGIDDSAAESPVSSNNLSTSPSPAKSQLL